jgi:copper oxidase (laccase) domain-containing protein
MMRPLLSYYPVADGVTAFSTTRHGGVSSGNYGEFNINEYCGDEAEAIKS